MVALTTLLRWATSWGYIESNPGDGFRLPKKREKVAETSRRLPFSPSQMRALETSLKAEFAETSDDRWIPLVAAYQGCRLEEVTQLLKSDVREVDGVWVLEITDAGAEQKVKNKSSRRTVPLHPKLIEKGFLAHRERSPGPRLFQQLTADQRGRYGGPYGKRFARHLHKRTKIVDDALTFHSLRHAWKTAARNAEVPEAHQAAIMGHQHGTAVSDGYGVKHAVSVLLPWLAKVDPFADPGTSPELTTVSQTDVRLTD
jgi:integrase